MAELVQGGGAQDARTARGALAMDEEALLPLAANRVLLLLARVVRDVVEELESRGGEQLAEHAAREMREHLAVPERGVDTGAHGTEVALTELGADRSARELAFG